MPIEECRIYGPDGKLKKVISPEEASKLHWESATFDCLLNTPKYRHKFIEHIEQNYVCEKCNKEFKAIEERAFCYNPCQDVKEKLTRPDPSLGKTSCKLCKKAFMPNTRRQIYCNNPCITQMDKRKQIRIGKTRHCKQCNKVFKTEGKRKYCYEPCTRYTNYKLLHSPVKEKNNAIKS